MRRMTCLLGAVALVLGVSGCTVSHYERTVTVQRDASGEVTGVTEVEHMAQRGNRKKLPSRFLYDKEIATQDGSE